MGPSHTRAAGCAEGCFAFVRRDNLRIIRPGSLVKSQQGAEAVSNAPTANGQCPFRQERCNAHDVPLPLTRPPSYTGSNQVHPPTDQLRFSDQVHVTPVAITRSSEAMTFLAEAAAKSIDEQEELTPQRRHIHEESQRHWEEEERAEEEDDKKELDALEKTAVGCAAEEQPRAKEKTDVEPWCSANAQPLAESVQEVKVCAAEDQEDAQCCQEHGASHWQEEEELRRQELREQRERRLALSRFYRRWGFEGPNHPRCNGCGIFGLTTTYPLHQAAELADVRVIEMLLKEGAELGKKNSAKLSAAQVARRMNSRGSHRAVLRALSAKSKVSAGATEAAASGDTARK